MTQQMAELGLKDVLNDPNYVSANAETKKAIFDKYSSKEPDYINANEYQIEYFLIHY